MLACGVGGVMCVIERQSKSYNVILQQRGETAWTRASSMTRFPVHLQTQMRHLDVVDLLKGTNHWLHGWSTNSTVFPTTSTWYDEARMENCSRVHVQGGVEGVLMIFNESAFISFHPGNCPFSLAGKRKLWQFYFYQRKKINEGVTGVCLFPVL